MPSRKKPKPQQQQNPFAPDRFYMKIQMRESWAKIFLKFKYGEPTDGSISLTPENICKAVDDAKKVTDLLVDGLD